MRERPVGGNLPGMHFDESARVALVLSLLLLLPMSVSAVGNDLRLIDAQSTADVYVDPHDAKVVQLAGGLLADDAERVTGHRPAVKNDSAALGPTAILIGTIGQSAVIDQLVASGKIDVSAVKGQWESYLRQTVIDPLPGVHNALVIAGGDRRGTAYGVADLSREMGLSPWYWWADVPATRRAEWAVSTGRIVSKSPGVKYRGIFLNDEDWGLRPWGTKTFDPQTGALGPKTYGKIFELMLRLKLNYIWPAMHPGGTEFSTFPGNAELADQWGIVTGSSHCEPMLRNNVFWPKSSGVWRYDVNRDAIFNYWKESAVNRGNFEAVWTLGIRGIHDSAMQGPKELPARVKMVEGIFSDQRSLIDQYVTKKFGPVGECFVPYKEVLPLYDAGLKVPEDATLVWPDDNYGYVRRLGTPEERKRSGGSGVYYHISYWGSPHSYLWVESTSPGLMWEELRKTFDNDSKTIWILNVGDIKPAEVAIDFYSRLAWDPAAWGPDSQQTFLASFDAETFGSVAPQVVELQAAYYRLATTRKPEHIDYPWIDSLSLAEASRLTKAYQSLLDQEKTVAAAIPADRADAYFETVGYAARMLGATGLLYLGDDEIAKKQKQYIDEQTSVYNDKIAGGKWHLMMSTTPEGVVWPKAVGGKAKEVVRSENRPADRLATTIDAADGVAHSSPAAEWKPVAGLGWSGRAIAIVPSIPGNHWNLEQITSAPSMEYQFEMSSSGDATIRLQALPTLRLTLGGKLRVAMSVDGKPPQAMDVPGGESDNELGKQRRAGVLANRVTLEFAAGSLSAGPHTLKVYAMDPGVVLDQIDLPPMPAK